MLKRRSSADATDARAPKRVRETALEKEARQIAQKVSEGETIRAVSMAAMKARARHLGMGEVIKVGDHSLVVEEDDINVFVQMVLSIEAIDEMARDAAMGLGIHTPGVGEMDEVLKALHEILMKWHQVSLRMGPGQNVTLEKTAYKREAQWRQE